MKFQDDIPAMEDRMHIALGQAYHLKMASDYSGLVHIHKYYNYF